MATQCFFRNTEPDCHFGTNTPNLRASNVGWYPRALATTRGPSLTSDTGGTVTGPTAGVELFSSPWSAAYEFISPPIDADVTISGAITGNLWSLESSMNANAAINFAVYKVDRATGVQTLIVKSARTVELGTSAAVANFTATPGAGVACSKGDRLRVLVFADDASGVNMATGFTFTLGYNGPTAAANGDSYVTFTETFGFLGTPSGSIIYLRDDASDVVTAKDDREAWTNRGNGSTSIVQNTATGWTAGIHMGDIDWFTRPLTAFTLAGIVQVEILEAAANLASKASLAVEIARVDNDGTNPLVIGRSCIRPNAGVGPLGEINGGTYEAIIGCDDTVFTDGQRIRIRLYLEDISQAPLVTGHTLTVDYAGSSAGNDDTHIILPQTVTEFSSSTPKASSDTGAGADTLVETAQIPSTETGAGAETHGLTSIFAQTDTGSGADALSVTVPKALTDTGTSTDTLSEVAAIPQVDTGAGVEVLAELAQVPSTDTGSGLDVHALAATLAQTDTGSGVEVLDVSAGAVPVAVSDSGTSSDALNRTAAYAITDVGAGAEVLAEIVQILQSDVGAGTEILTRVGLYSLLDTGAGSEVLAGSAVIPVTDAGSGVDALARLAAYAITDSGLASEALVLSAQIASQETGLGAEVLAILASILHVDIGSGSDALAVAADGSLFVSFNDAAVGTDLHVLQAQVLSQDTTSGVDTLARVASYIAIDSGSGADAAVVAYPPFSLSDSGSGTDLLTPRAVYVVAESGVMSDLVTLATALLLTETGLALETMLLGAVLASSDSGTAVDIFVLLPDNLVFGARVEVVEGGLTITAVSPIGSTIDQFQSSAISDASPRVTVEDRTGTVN